MKNISIERLAKFHSDQAKYLDGFIIVDEKFVHDFTPEMKEQSKQWN